jgi:hypothetical protein
MDADLDLVSRRRRGHPEDRRHGRRYRDRGRARHLGPAATVAVVAAAALAVTLFAHQFRP